MKLSYFKENKIKKKIIYILFIILYMEKKYKILFL